MAFKDLTIQDFTTVLSTSEPVPGGGGACGLVAAVGTSLGNMVLSLTTGKKKFAEYQKEIDEYIAQLSELTEMLLDDMDKDAEAFEPLAKAYSLPKDTKEEIEAREKIMEEALFVASEAPLNMMETIIRAIKVVDRVTRIGTRFAVSDAGVALQCLRAAINGASLNVFINTKAMKNREVADALADRATKLVEEAEAIVADAYVVAIDRL